LNQQERPQGDQIRRNITKNVREEQQDHINELLGLSSEFTLLEKRTIDAEEKTSKYEERVAQLKAKLK
jgi:hypothetical protein